MSNVTGSSESKEEDDEENIKVEIDYDELDIGIMDSIVEGLRVAQLNMGKKIDFNDIQQYSAENRLQCDGLEDHTHSYVI